MRTTHLASCARTCLNNIPDGKTMVKHRLIRRGEMAVAEGRVVFVAQRFLNADIGPKFALTFRVSI